MNTGSHLKAVPFIAPKTQHMDCIIVHCGFCWWRNWCLCDIFLTVLPYVIKKIRNKPLLSGSDVLHAKPDVYCLRLEISR